MSASQHFFSKKIDPREQNSTKPVEETKIGKKKEERRSYLSILMATRFSIEAVLSVTSNAIQKSQMVSLNSQSTLTCKHGRK
jgi:hypothetical protein